MSRGPDRIEIVWSDEDAAYVATVSGVDGCSALGPTPEQALREVLVVLTLWTGIDPATGGPEGREESEGPRHRVGEARVAPGP